MVWPLVVSALQFEPRVEGIDGAAGEKVADFLRAHHHIHADRVSAAQRRLHQVQRRCYRNRFSGGLGWHFSFSFFANGKRGCQLRLRGRARRERSLGWRYGENIDCHRATLQEILREFQLRRVFIRGWHRGVRRRETMRVHEAVDVARVLRSFRRACGNRRTAAVWADNRTNAHPARKLRWPASCRIR